MKIDIVAIVGIVALAVVAIFAIRSNGAGADTIAGAAVGGIAGLLVRVGAGQTANVERAEKVQS